MKYEDNHGYGDLTNLIAMKKVFMVEHKEGTGLNGDSPMRIVRTFFDEDCNFLCRDDFKTRIKS